MYEGPELNHAFGLCHYSNFLFWTEYRSGSIYRLDQASKAVSLLRNERPPIFEIRMYDAQQQQGARARGAGVGGMGLGGESELPKQPLHLVLLPSSHLRAPCFAFPLLVPCPSSLPSFSHPDSIRLCVS